MKANIDFSTHCQLNCTCCDREKITKNLGQGHLTLASLQKIIILNPTISSIEISNYGEPFLNPELKPIIQFCHEKNIKLTAYNGSSISSINKMTAELLVRYKFKGITASINASSAETYSKYHINGDFNVVLESIREINFFKKKYQSPYPKLRWQFIPFHHNQHETRSASLLAKSLGMKFYIKKSTSPILKSPKKISLKNIWKPKKIVMQYLGRNFFLKTHCLNLIFRPQINWNGQVLGCCINKEKSFGDALNMPLTSIINDGSINDAIKMHAGLIDNLDHIPCSRCHVFQRKSFFWKVVFSILSTKLGKKIIHLVRYK